MATKRTPIALLVCLLSTLVSGVTGQERIALTSHGEPAHGDICYDCGEVSSLCRCDCRVSFSADVIFLGRNRAHDQSIIFGPGANPVEVLNVDDLHFDLRGGVRSQLAFECDGSRRIDISYFGIFHQTADEVRTDPNMSFRLYGVSPTVATAGYGVNYSSYLHNIEVNLHSCSDRRIRPLIGLRWIQQAENFDVMDTTGTSWDLLSEFDNDLFGGQVGTTIDLWGRFWFRVEGTIKGGVFYNKTDLDVTLLDAGGNRLQQLASGFDRTAYAGEAGLSVVWTLTQHLTLRCGYSGLWLWDVGLAADQANNFSLNSGQGLPDLSDVVYQGGHFGLELTW